MSNQVVTMAAFNLRFGDRCRSAFDVMAVSQYTHVKGKCTQLNVYFQMWYVEVWMNLNKLFMWLNFVVSFIFNMAISLKADS